MALVECNGCGEVVSNRAKSCPQCGEPTKKKGSYLMMVFGALLGVLIMLIYSGSDNTPHPVNTANQDAVTSLFKSDKEKIAKDALWVGSSLFRVGVIDDGTRRDGYADYVCSVLKDYGFSGVTVRVNDIVKIARENKWVELGKSNCK